MKNKFNKKVKVIDIIGLDKKTVSKIEYIMIYTKNYFSEDGVMFVELKNSKKEIIRIFPERIQCL